MSATLKQWRYEICYGPNGEENYAFVYDADGELVSNLKIHHARSVVEAMNRRADGWQEPTDEEVHSACLSYRHDYGLLPEHDRASLRRTAKWWLDAWRKAKAPEAS